MVGTTAVVPTTQNALPGAARDYSENIPGSTTPGRGIQSRPGSCLTSL